MISDHTSTEMRFETGQTLYHETVSKFKQSLTGIASVIDERSEIQSKLKTMEDEKGRAITCARSKVRLASVAQSGIGQHAYRSQFKIFKTLLSAAKRLECSAT